MLIKTNIINNNISKGVTLFELHVIMDFNLQSVFLIKSSFFECGSCTSSIGGPLIDGANFGAKQHRISTYGIEHHHYLAYVSLALERKNLISMREKIPSKKRPSYMF